MYRMFKIEIHSRIACFLFCTRSSIFWYPLIKTSSLVQYTVVSPWFGSRSVDIQKHGSPTQEENSYYLVVHDRLFSMELNSIHHTKLTLSCLDMTSSAVKLPTIQDLAVVSQSVGNLCSPMLCTGAFKMDVTSAGAGFGSGSKTGYF